MGSTTLQTHQCPILAAFAYPARAVRAFFSDGERGRVWVGAPPAAAQTLSPVGRAQCDGPHTGCGGSSAGRGAHLLLLKLTLFP
jgi:hypothetical protein